MLIDVLQDCPKRPPRVSKKLSGPKKAPKASKHDPREPNKSHKNRRQLLLTPGLFTPLRCYEKLRCQPCRPSRRPYGTPFNLPRKIRRGNVRMKRGVCPPSLCNCMLIRVPDHGKSPVHRRWTGWWGCPEELGTFHAINNAREWGGGIGRLAHLQRRSAERRRSPNVDQSHEHEALIERGPCPAWRACSGGRARRRCRGRS